MAVPVFVLGHSGSGKSFSLHNLNPNNVGLINVVGKPLPFKEGKNFTARTVTTDNPVQICHLLVKSTAPIMIIDDFQYIMSNEFMRESETKGFGKFTKIGRHAWDILNVMNYRMKPYQRVYVLAHTDTVDGVTKMKTIGRMLDEKITPEGLVTIVLQTHIENGQNYFLTKNNGYNTVKTPYEMFDTELIPNDLNFVDNTICDYYGLPTQVKS